MPDRDVAITASVASRGGVRAKEVALESGGDYRPDIDGLRALAILAVIGFHAFPSLVPGGFIGVDIFFVISGYLISGIIVRGLERNRFTYWEFYSRRVRRIFPALTVVLLASIAFGWFFLLPEEYLRLAKHVMAGALFVSNWVLWGESGYFDVGALLKPLLHLWSLGVEEQFYMAWPLVLVWASRSRQKTIYLVAMVMIASFVANAVLVKEQPETTFYLPFTRFWELLVGAIIACQRIDLIKSLCSTGSKISTFLGVARLMISVAGLALIGVSLAIINNESSFPGWWALLPVVGTALVISAGPDSWVNTRLLGSPPLIFVGLISYPLYLWHWLMLFMANQLLDSGSVGEFRTYRIAAIILSFLLAYGTYIYIELPIRRLPAKRVVTWLSLALGLVAIIALGISATDGALRQRFQPEEILAFQNQREERLAVNKNYRYGSCLLLRPQRTSDFAQECYAGIAPDVLLLGDSYAAHLYPGLAVLSSRRSWSIGQVTASACPPVSNFDIPDRHDCRALNAEIEGYAANNRSRAIIVAADWPKYWHLKGFPQGLQNSLRQMKNSWKGKILLVGPVVAYPIEQLAWVVRKGDIGRMTSFNPRLPELREIDDMMRSMSKDLDIVYVSPVTALCSGQECQYAIQTNSGRKLFAVDWGHLTYDGSRFYTEKFLAPLLEPLFN